ncbi:MAG: lipid-binding SYLF domain-containing protein, partial [Candidatus Aminicenantes bacterium]|nr:lipid-binding SYLF domain-containing protein [Candidatus Aminicenantes bacterium]
MNRTVSIKWMCIFLLSACSLSFLSGAPSASGIQTDEIQRVNKSMDVLTEIINLPEEGLPEALLRKAYAVAIFPGVIKAAYGIGGQFGKGIVLVRSGKNRWSYPCFIRLVGGSVGWQIGIQKMDIVLVFKS